MFLKPSGMGMEFPKFTEFPLDTLESNAAFSYNSYNGISKLQLGIPSMNLEFLLGNLTPRSHLAG